MISKLIQTTKIKEEKQCKENHQTKQNNTNHQIKMYQSLEKKGIE